MSSTAVLLITLSVALLAGLLLSRLAKKLNLPAVTAYLVAGVLIGPFVLGAFDIPGLGITHNQLADFGVIADVALGFIAFSMGDEFRLSDSGDVINVEYRLEKFKDQLDESFYENVKEGDELTLRINRNPGTAKSSNKDEFVELYTIYGITSGEIEYFGEEHIARGERENTTAIVVSASVYVVYCAICGVAIYLAKKYAEQNFENETVEITELV
jgi:hypothetical protein